MKVGFSIATLFPLLAVHAAFDVEAQVAARDFAGSSLSAPRSNWMTNGGD